MSTPHDHPDHEHAHGESCPSCGGHHDHDDHGHAHAHEEKHEPHTHSHEPEPPSPENPDDARSLALADALKSSFAIVKVLMAVLVIVFIGSGMFTVGPQEKAVILRFGKPLGTGEEAVRGAGLHWAWPYPIDEVIKIPVVQVQTATSTAGWYATDAKMEAAGIEPPPGPTLRPAADGYALTADGNIIHARATLRYRVSDPVRFYFGFTNAPALVTNLLNNALLFAAAQTPVDDALRKDLAGFKERVFARVDAQIRAINLGITREPSDVTAIPPRQVKAQFEAVFAAQLDSSKQRNEAEGYANETVARVRGEHAARLAAARTASERHLRSIEADAKTFTDLLPSYLASPDLFTRRLQTETLARVMTNAQDKFFLPERTDGKPRELRLQLNREPVKAKQAEPVRKDEH